MSGLAFHKYEGLGNDFVLVEAEAASSVPPELVRLLCNRRRGVGADGVLLLLPPSDSAVDARMKVVNADGSVPEMCGNGLRCAVLHLGRRRRQEQANFVLETGAGLRSAELDDRNGRGQVTVNMGVVSVLGDVRLAIDGEPWNLTLADAGNPHAVYVSGSQRPTRTQVEVVGPQIATHASFLHGTNVEFAHYAKGVVDLIVYERGVGVTMACGTGACATVAVGVEKGLFSALEAVTVNLPGGSLQVTLLEDRRAMMRGPARYVFSGSFRP